MEWRQEAERLKLTVQAEFINPDYDFSKPKAPSNPKSPKNPPSDDKLIEYENSFFNENTLEGGEDGASALYASAAASLLTLAALTLY